MRMYPSRIVCHAVALISLLAVYPGCVKRMSATNEPGKAEATALATLRSLAVSADASRIELTSDKPFTYTSYKAGAPAKIVVDLSMTEPGFVASDIEVNRGNLRRIGLLRQPVGGGVLTRVEISLARDADFTVATDPSDKKKLLVTLMPAETQVSALPPEVKEVLPVEAKIIEQTVSPEASPKPAESVSVVMLSEEVTAGQGAKAESGELQRRLNAILTAKDGVELSIAGNVQTFNSFKLSKPDRIVLDIFGMKNALVNSVVPIGAFGVANARVGSTPDKVRVVLDASRETLPPFEVVKSELGLKIRFKPQTAGEAAPAAPFTPSPAAPVVAFVPVPAAVKVEVPSPPHSRGSMETLDFNVVDGVSRITMKLSGTCEPGHPVQVAQGLSLSIKDCQVPKGLQRALDTSQFGSPVLAVTPYQVKVQGAFVAKVMVRLHGNPPFTMKRKGDILVLDVATPVTSPVAKLPTSPSAARPATETEFADELAPAARSEEMVVQIPRSEAGKRAAKKEYRGRRVTLEFSDADVRKIFQLIAEVSNLNFLIADDVTGTISIKLVNVPWDQALDVILDAKDLGMQQDGNIVQIKPKAKMQTQADAESAAKKAAELGMELRTAVFEVNYAAVSEVAVQFAALKSDRGTITKDDRTSRVIVKDIQTALDDMRQLLKTLDAPEKQVMIEARIVEATSTFTRDLGVQWGLSYKDGSASVAGINTVDTGFGGVVSSAGPGSTGSGGLGLGMSFGKLTSNIQLDMRLAAAATIGQVKIISTPKVVTLNNKAAKISQGQSIPYQTFSAEGTKTEFVEAALTLEVTPHITSDGAVSMKIKASNNSPGTGSPPPINKKEATTELVVANGETTVIGGIYVDSDTDSDTGVPFLADIPLLGWLFKSNTKQKTKTELLIFITPKVVI